MPYPTPTNITGLKALFQYGNQVSNNWFCILICFAVFIIVFINLVRRYRISDSLALSSVFSFIITALFWGAGLVQTKILTIFLLIMIASVLYSFIEK